MLDETLTQAEPEWIEPETTGLRIVDLISQGRNADSACEHRLFREVFWLKEGRDTIFRYPTEEEEHPRVAYLMGMCKDGDDFCCHLAKDQSLPAPETRRDFPCGCAIVCIEFPLIDDLDFGSESDSMTAMDIIVRSKMKEAIERLRSGT